jgi:hypothetical protein
MPYKTCRSCGTMWETPLDVLRDKNLRVDGYQATFPDALDGLVMLTHVLPHCRSTIAVLIRDYRFLYDGPHNTELLKGSDSCAGYCLDHNNLEQCQTSCSMAWARTVMQYFREHEVPLRVLAAVPETAC